MYFVLYTYTSCILCYHFIVTARDRCIAFVSTFACFLTRAFDNLRMGVISQTNINVMGSHCGVSIGEDGPSQMALEDLAMFQVLQSSPSATLKWRKIVQIVGFNMHDPLCSHCRAAQCSTPPTR